jgi:hypothetical protein
MDEQAEKDPKEEIFFFIEILIHLQIFENLSKDLKKFLCSEWHYTNWGQ